MERGIKNRTIEAVSPRLGDFLELIEKKLEQEYLKDSKEQTFILTTEDDEFEEVSLKDKEEEKRCVVM